MLIRESYKSDNALNICNHWIVSSIVNVIIDEVVHSAIITDSLCYYTGIDTVISVLPTET